MMKSKYLKITTVTDPGKMDSKLVEQEPTHCRDLTTGRALA